MEFRTFVNPEKRVVVVKITDAINELDKEFIEFYRKFHVVADWKVWGDFTEKYRHELNNLTGMAICNVDAGDVFDAEIGERIARERCLAKFERLRQNMYCLIAIKQDTVFGEAARRQVRSYGREKRRFENVTKILTEKA